jgi:hypothetical protein
MMSRFPEHYRNVLRITLKTGFPGFSLSLPPRHSHLPFVCSKFISAYRSTSLPQAPLGDVPERPRMQFLQEVIFLTFSPTSLPVHPPSLYMLSHFNSVYRVSLYTKGGAVAPFVITTASLD